MIKLTISFEAPNTDSWEFEYSCPICRLETTITLGQVRREEYFICRGCYKTVKVIDHLGDAQHLKDRMNEIFR
jgi:transposase-like protein